MLNKYKCLECGEEWEDEWECACDDDCPVCGTTMTAHDLDDNGNYTPIILTKRIVIDLTADCTDALDRAMGEAIRQVQEGYACGANYDENGNFYNFTVTEG